MTGVDLSAFSGGSVSVDVSTVDLAGNPATATSVAEIDTTVTIDIDTGPDGLPLTEFLLGNVSEIIGTTDAEDGQTVTVRLSDGTNTNILTGIVAAGAWSVAVDASGLAPLAGWTLAAVVQDQAGNLAADATPTLELPQVMTLSERDLGLSAVSRDDGEVRIQNADDVQWSTTQDSLSALTSEGTPVMVAVSGDGQTITVTRDNGGGAETVFTATLDGTGNISTALFLPIDQPNALNVSLIKLALNATQNDADGTAETIAADVFVLVQEC